MEIRNLNLKDPRMKAFGTINGGLELTNAALPSRCQAFAVRREAGESWFWLIFPCGLDVALVAREAFGLQWYTVALVSVYSPYGVGVTP